MARRTHRLARRFLRSEDGAVLVEFSLILPLMILVFVLGIEGARLLLSYQTAISGVRDAGRYLARTAPGDICATGGSVTGYTAKLKEIVETGIGAGRLYPAAVTVNSVTPSLACVPGSYRINPVPVATVTASISIDFPLRGILDLFGGGLNGITTTVADSSRIFGQ